ncbi:MAG TPA: tetratricopeptide repeat protein [Pirellulales bacterium]|jgi:tetratricopeptide (TPR) repeat protein|nr:tetratricopeptide repeat protein [Pirellulales bacterium]
MTQPRNSVRWNFSIGPWKRTGNRKSLQFGALIFCAFLSGCAGLGDTNQAVKRNTANDAGPSRDDRKKALARDFDQQRDDAQLDAAASCWQRGDLDGCNRILDQLLNRDSNNRRARMLLADVDLFTGHAEQAATELQTLVTADPKDAVAQHALAQVCDACGRRTVALEHYQIATQLDPQNEEYALSYKMATGVATVPSGNAAIASAPQKQSDSASPAATIPSASPVKLASAALPVVKTQQPVEKSAALNFCISDAPADNFQTESVPTASVPAANSVADEAHSASPSDWRLCDSPIVQKREPVFMPPGKVTDWLGRLDFGDSADDKHSATNSQIFPTQNTSSPRIISSPTTASPPVGCSAQSSAGSLQPALLAEPSNRPQNLQDPLHQAAAALGRGDTQAAIEIASRGLSETPEQAAVLYRLLGTAHYRRAEYEAAQAALAQALSLDKGDALSYFLMGSTLDKLAQHEAAQGYFAEAARLDPRFAY